VQAQQAADVARRKVKEEISRQFDGIQSGASPFTRDAVVASVTSGAKAKGLRSAERQVRVKLSNLPAAQSKYLQLQTNLRDERLRLSQIRSEYVKAEWIARSRGPQFVVVDPPNAPERPNGYGFLEYLILGLLRISRANQNRQYINEFCKSNIYVEDGYLNIDFTFDNTEIDNLDPEKAFKGRCKRFLTLFNISELDENLKIKLRCIGKLPYDNNVYMLEIRNKFVNITINNEEKNKPQYLKSKQFLTKEAYILG
jgi:hypothetical protein